MSGRMMSLRVKGSNLLPSNTSNGGDCPVLSQYRTKCFVAKTAPRNDTYICFLADEWRERDMEQLAMTVEIGKGREA